MMQKTVDVIIPTYRPGRKFRQLLKMLSVQSYPVHKIIIINTEAEYLDERSIPYANAVVRHISKSEFDHGRSRNLGVSLSDADYFLLMTDDAVPRDTELTAALVKALEEDPMRGSAYARQLPGKESSADERYSRRFNYPETSREKSLSDLPVLGIKTYFSSNVCCMYRRDLFDQLGGFVNRAIFNEDMIYACRLLHAGYKIYYCAEAQVYHAHNFTALQQLHRNFDLGVSQAEHPEVFGGIRSEGEGRRLVMGNAAELLRTGRIWLLPGLVFRSGCKLIGYKLGKNYRKLPRSLVLRLTMNLSLIHI